MARRTTHHSFNLSMITLLLMLQGFLIPFISCQHNVSGAEDLADSPYEQLYFKINEGQEFHKGLKYPPFRRCVVPDRLTKHHENSTKAWRLYWSTVAWSAYFYENGNELANWEREKENGDENANSWQHSSIPILILIVWTFIAGWVCLFLFPILSMIVFRILYLVWDFMTNKYFIAICRWIVIKIVKAKRDQVLRVFKNAGHRPPIFRYSLPKFLRRDPYEKVPKELDESEDEFWSSDDEINNTGQHPTPEFVPEYPAEVAEKTQLLSNEMFAYLRKVKQYGMLAVWTEGTDQIDLAGIANRAKPPNKFPSKMNMHKK